MSNILTLTVYTSPGAGFCEVSNSSNPNLNGANTGRRSAVCPKVPRTLPTNPEFGYPSTVLLCYSQKQQYSVHSLDVEVWRTFYIERKW